MALVTRTYNSSWNVTAGISKIGRSFDSSWDILRPDIKSITYIDGFDVGTDLNWSGTFTLTVSTRFGSGMALYLNRSDSYASRGFTGLTEIFIGFAYQVTTATPGAIVSLWGDNFGTKHLYLGLITTTKIGLYRGDGTLLAVAAIVYGKWNYIEMSATIANSGGTCKIRVRGIDVISYVGDTRNGGTATSVSGVRFGYDGVNASGGKPYIDDFYISSSEFLGNVRALTLGVDAAGSLTQFTPTGSSSNYQNVGEVPDSTATYNESAYGDATDLYAVRNISGDFNEIHGMQLNLHLGAAASGSVSVNPTIKTNSTTHTATAVTPSTSFACYGTILNANPVTGLPWTSDEINALEIGAKIVR